MKFIFITRRVITLKIIKRNGEEREFDVTKIQNAIHKANAEVSEKDQLSKAIIEKIASEIEKLCEEFARVMNVEEIQDSVEKKLMEYGAYEVARKYITYRYVHALLRKANTTDKTILSLIDCSNEEAKQENSNNRYVFSVI